MNALQELLTKKDPIRAEASMRFFKTGPGHYGAGDKFLGVSVPSIRKIAKNHKDADLNEIEGLVQSPWHEARLLGLIMLVNQYKNADFHGQKQQIVDFYINNLKYVNNWDLVDSSAPYILGGFVYEHPNYYGALNTLAHSNDLWKKRVGMLSTFYFIRKGSSKECFEIADILLNDDHDLIHKAVGWMLRETGKSCGQEVLEEYLKTRYKTMPRTMLRYAIEKFEPSLRAEYLAGGI